MSDRDRVDRMVAALVSGSVTSGDLDHIQRKHVQIVETARLLVAEVDRTEGESRPVRGATRRGKSGVLSANKGRNHD